MNRYSNQCSTDFIEDSEGKWSKYSEAQAEIDEILNGVANLKCTCVPYATTKKGNVCGRCLLINKHRRKNDVALLDKDKTRMAN